MRITFFILLLSITAAGYAQPQFRITELAPMPIAIANNAVVAANVQGEAYVYSFGGIVSGLSFINITQQAFRYHVASNTWDTIPPLPDTLGKIASAASYMNGKIYIIGGYHVMANGHEVSSSRVHIFDTQTNTYLPDGAPVPVPIDDHVQTIWRDSLIYLVAGWSNTAHETRVQIYNPATDTWAVGSSIPNTIDYKAFGASGVIIGDTIFYMGGARNGLNFPVASELRKGVINPTNPSLISWSYSIRFNTAGYRMGAAKAGNWAVWIGGAANTYNYNAAAYDGSGVINPENRIILYNPTLDSLLIYQDSLPLPTMDMRGTGQLDGKRFIICGGLLDNAIVSNHTFLFEDLTPTGIMEAHGEWSIKYYPNPTQGPLTIEVPINAQIKVTNLTGKTIIPSISAEANTTIALNIPPSLASGLYLLHIETSYGVAVHKVTLVR